MLWGHLGLGEQGVRGKPRRGDSTVGSGLEGKAEHLLPVPREQLLCPVKTLRDPPYAVWKTAYLRFIQFLPVHCRFHHLIHSPPGEERMECNVVEHRCRPSACPKREESQTPHFRLGLPLLSTSLHSVLMTFLYLRKLLFLANSCVSYKIKLFRKLTDLRNQCFSSFTKKAKYWHHLKGTSRN